MAAQSFATSSETKPKKIHSFIKDLSKFGIQKEVVSSLSFLQLMQDERLSHATA
jgi:hypothetical protein